MLVTHSNYWLKFTWNPLNDVCPTPSLLALHEFHLISVLQALFKLKK